MLQFTRPVTAQNSMCNCPRMKCLSFIMMRSAIFLFIGDVSDVSATSLCTTHFYLYIVYIISLSLSFSFTFFLRAPLFSYSHFAHTHTHKTGHFSGTWEWHQSTHRQHHSAAVQAASPHQHSHSHHLGPSLPQGVYDTCRFYIIYIHVILASQCVTFKFSAPTTQLNKLIRSRSMENLKGAQQGTEEFSHLKFGNTKRPKKGLYDFLCPCGCFHLMNFYPCLYLCYVRVCTVWRGVLSLIFHVILETY